MKKNKILILSILTTLLITVMFVNFRTSIFNESLEAFAQIQSQNATQGNATVSNKTGDLQNATQGNATVSNKTGDLINGNALNQFSPITINKSSSVVGNASLLGTKLDYIKRIASGDINSATRLVGGANNTIGDLNAQITGEMTGNTYYTNNMRALKSLTNLEITDAIRMIGAGNSANNANFTIVVDSQTNCAYDNSPNNNNNNTYALAGNMSSANNVSTPNNNITNTYALAGNMSSANNVSTPTLSCSIEVVIHD